MDRLEKYIPAPNVIQTRINQLATHIMEEIKGTKHDIGKLRYDLIPPQVEEQLAKVLTYGAEKYGENNWQHVPDLQKRYYAALRRHLAEWRKGNKIDEESGEPHLAHVLANVAFLLWAENRKGKEKTVYDENGNCILKTVSYD